MDKIDEKILNTLIRNSKLSYRKIASKVGVSGVTALKRVSRLKKEGVINSYTVNLDYEKLGYDVSAVIRMRIVPGKYAELKKLVSHKNVFAIYDVTGDFDAVMIVKFKNRRSMNLFLKRIQTYDFIERTETSLILNTICEGGIEVGD